MKFQLFIALQKHLKSLKQIPRSYLIVHPQREERRKVLEKLGQEILSRQEESSILFLESDQVEWGKVYETLMTPSLFGGEEIVMWNGVKTAPDALFEYIIKPSPRAFFLIGADSFKGFSELYEKTKQSLVLLDLSEEKPWEKQKRLQQELLQMAKDASKVIAPEAVDSFFSLCAVDSLVLELEFAKLLSYVGSRTDISEKDVLAIVTPSSTATGWQLSEALVWGDTLSFHAASIDLSFILALFGQVRFYLQQGRQVGWCLQQKMTPDEISKAIPNVKPAQFQKISAALRLRKMLYFDEALASLYEVELLAKNSNLTPSFLFDLLQTKLTYLKQTQTR